MHFEFGLRLAEPKWGIAVQNFKNKDTEGPHICLGAVDVVDKCLWAHVDGTSDIDVLETLPV